MTTEVCVHTTVREANDRGYDCLVVSDCVGSYFPDFQQAGPAMIAAGRQLRLGRRFRADHRRTRVRGHREHRGSLNRNHRCPSIRKSPAPPNLLPRWHSRG
ncbi:isochorismatase family protein [Nocardia sp. NPDC006044]|uniref:isochorismatase family protein n=1 Tax=Nocardia sp. NPDC006044 TaxID=3364306 RepID=UPI0036C911CF